VKPEGKDQSVSDQLLPGVSNSCLSLGLAVALYFTLLLPQYSDYIFGFDCFYYLGRARQAIAEPLSIFKPDYALRFHPLSFFFASFLYRILGSNPLGYGTIAVIIHTLNALCLFHLVRKIGAPNGIATLSAILFLFLSSQWGIISDIPQLVRLAASLFFLLSLVLFAEFLRTEGKMCFIFSWIFFVSSFGFNEDGITLPLLLLALAFFPALLRPTCLKSLPYIVSFFVPAGLYTLYALRVGSPQEYHLGVGLRMFVKLAFLIKEFIHTLFIPRQEWVSFLPGFSMFVRSIPFGLIALFVLWILKLRKVEPNKLLIPSPAYGIGLFALSWIILTALPYSMRPGEWYWENRYLYIPGMGVSILGSLCIWKLWTAVQEMPGWLSKGKTSFFKLGLYTAICYILSLNAATTIFMFHKFRAEMEPTTKEDLMRAGMATHELWFVEEKILETLPEK